MEDLDEIGRRGLKENPFWVGVLVIWIIMLIVGVTLTLTLGIWFLIGAF